MRNTLQNHIRQYGADGRFTFHAGLTVEQAAEIGTEAVKRSTLHEFSEGDTVVIRGTDIACPVEQVLGVFLILKWTPVTAKSFRDLPVQKKGRYVYGRVKIYKGHVELAEGV